MIKAPATPCKEKVTVFVPKFQYKIHLKRAIYIFKQMDFASEHTFRMNGYSISPTLLNIEIPFRTKILAVDIRLHYKIEHTISSGFNHNHSHLAVEIFEQLKIWKSIFKVQEP